MAPSGIQSEWVGVGPLWSTVGFDFRGVSFCLFTVFNTAVVTHLTSFLSLQWFYSGFTQRQAASRPLTLTLHVSMSPDLETMSVIHSYSTLVVLCVTLEIPNYSVNVDTRREARVTVAYNEGRKQPEMQKHTARCTLHKTWHVWTSNHVTTTEKHLEDVKLAAQDSLAEIKREETEITSEESLKPSQ